MTRTIIQETIATGNYGAVELELAAFPGAIADLDEHTRPPVFEAVHHPRILELLLMSGGDVDVQEPHYGYTPLIYAITRYSGLAERAQEDQALLESIDSMLYSIFPDCELADHSGLNALMHAVHNGLPADTIRFIAHNTRGINHRSLDGDTALHLAVRFLSGQKAEEVIRDLLMSGARWDIKNEMGETALETLPFADPHFTAPEFLRAMVERRALAEASSKPIASARKRQRM